MTRLATSAALALSLAGCGATVTVSRPEAAVEAYRLAIEADDAGAAYALLDEETRSTLPEERFRALMADNRTELSDQGALLAERAQRGVEAEARVPLASGETVTLVLEDGRWRLDGDVLGAATLRTPRDAVLALRRALVRRSLPGLLRVLAREPRAEVEAEVGRVLDETEDELDLDYEVRGNEALVRTTGGREILMIREGGEWRIVEVR